MIVSSSRRSAGCPTGRRPVVEQQAVGLAGLHPEVCVERAAGRDHAKAVIEHKEGLDGGIHHRHGEALRFRESLKMLHQRWRSMAGARRSSQSPTSRKEAGDEP